MTDAEEPEHPGSVLKRILREIDRSQAWLAHSMTQTPKHVNRVCQGQAGMSCAFAMKLEHLLGVPAEDWLTLQVRYDVHHKRKAMVNYDADRERIVKRATAIAQAAIR